MKILFQDGLEQIKKVRPIAKNLEEAGKLAECLNHWNDDDSWGGSFGLTEFKADQLYNDWFINLRVIDHLIVDVDGKFQGYVDYNNHFEDDDAAYIPLLGVSPAAQGKGYGKSLLLSALEKVIELGKRRLDLHTWAGNLRSVPVYKKTGFFWRKDTAVLMENYLPAVLSTPYFEKFFTKNDFYDSRELEVTQEHDDYNYLTMQSYLYRFIEDDVNSLSVYVDCYAKELSGFSYLENNKNLCIQLIPNQHEIFVGIDKAIAELQIINERNYPIKIKGALIPHKGIKELSPNSVDLVIQPKEKITIGIIATIDLTTDTYMPTQQTEKRTNCRFTANLEINGIFCQLGCGWVPKDSISINLLKRSVYFGKKTENLSIPLGFRNLTQKSIAGNLAVNGKGLTKPHVVEFNLEADSAMETLIPIKKPPNLTNESWKWNLEFKIKTNSTFQQLPVKSTHISCFTGSGVLAYINTKPTKEAIIENEFYRFHFRYGRGTWGDLRTIFVKEMNLKLPLSALSVVIGRPFPQESSEFILMESSFEILQNHNEVKLKQEFLSTIEKPGLQVIRWIELDAGKKYLTSYYDLTNTNKGEDQAITNVSILNVNWRGQWTDEYGFFAPTLYGNYTIPTKLGLMVIDDPEFIDQYDFPQKPEDFIEPWFACEPHNAQSIGFGVIWDAREVERIIFRNPYWGPNIETIAYDLKPGQTIRTGHYTLVLGQPAVQLTRKIWLEEFNGKAVLNKEKYYSKWAHNLLDTRLGKDLTIPDLNQTPFLSITLIDMDKETVDLNTYYYAKRKSAIDLTVDLSCNLWSKSQQVKLKLISDKEYKSSIPFEKTVSNQEPYVLPIEGILSLPLNNRIINGIGVPFHSKSQVKLEKSDNCWVFSNDLMNFRASEAHGASLFGANIGDNEDLFFSRFPNKESFVDFKNFVGGFHPLASVPRGSVATKFFDNIWTKPQLIEDDGWSGIQFSLLSANNDNRLKDIGYTMTYYVRPKSPLIWGSFTFINNSRMTTSIKAALYLYLKPIELFYKPWNNGFFIGKRSTQQRGFITTVPQNWVIVDWGINKLKALFASASPDIRIHGDYTNSNNYTELGSSSLFTLAPGETKRHDVILLFSKDLDDLKTFQKRQQVVRL